MRAVRKRRPLSLTKLCANLCNTIEDLPKLRLVQARHRGFAGEYESARTLMEGLPDALPELAFERARNAMLTGEVEHADQALQKNLAENPNDIGAWALEELC